MLSSTSQRGTRPRRRSGNRDRIMFLMTHPLAAKLSDAPEHVESVRRHKNNEFVNLRYETEPRRPCLAASCSAAAVHNGPNAHLSFWRAAEGQLYGADGHVFAEPKLEGPGTPVCAFITQERSIRVRHKRPRAPCSVQGRREAPSERSHSLARGERFFCS